MTDTVCIVGRGKTAKFVPWDDLSVDIWTLNAVAFHRRRRVTAMFDLHKDLLTSDRYPPEFADWLKETHPFPIYLAETNALIPSGVPFPFDAMAEEFGGLLYKGDAEVEHYETSTTPHLIRFAIFAGFQHIRLYGIELATEMEYAKHRESVLYWLGVARGRGVRVWIHETNPLYEEKRYP